MAKSVDLMTSYKKHIGTVSVWEEPSGKVVIESFVFIRSLVLTMLKITSLEYILSALFSIMGMVLHNVDASLV